MNDFATRIGTAYRWILGRDADPTGLAAYREQFEQGALTDAELREALLASPEFLQSREDLRMVDIGEGARVIVDAREPEFGKALVAHGAWEPHILHAISAILKPGDTFVDVGANVGVMSFHAAKAVGATGKVIAFEPNPANAQMFQRGMLANGCRNVRLHTIAAADRFDLIAISRTSNAKTQTMRDPLGYDHIVQADRLDRYLVSEARVDLVKIDIEGFELPALDGFTETIARHKPIILCEYNPLCFQALGFQPRDVADHYFRLGNRIEVIDHGLERLPVTSAEQLLALWRDRNQAAVRDAVLPDGWLHFDLVVQTG